MLTQLFGGVGAHCRLWQHYRTVPSLYLFKLFGLELSSKAFNWTLALQVSLVFRRSSSDLLKLMPARPVPPAALRAGLDVRLNNRLSLPHRYPPSPFVTPSKPLPPPQIVPYSSITVQPPRPAIPPFIKQHGCASSVYPRSSGSNQRFDPSSPHRTRYNQQLTPNVRSEKCAASARSPTGRGSYSHGHGGEYGGPAAEGRIGGRRGRDGGGGKSGHGRVGQ